METIKEIYKIGYGPSSSHTMGPKNAADIFLENNKKKAIAFKVTLHGSLAATGKGHLTDKVLKETFVDYDLEIIWKPEIVLETHPNGIMFEAIDDKGKTINKWTAFSVGGGTIKDEKSLQENTKVYQLNTMKDILIHCDKFGLPLWQYVENCEGEKIWKYLSKVWKVMRSSVERGLENEGVLPGSIHLQRKASSYHIKAQGFKDTLMSRCLVFAYALAVSEENAGGGKIVTAPTCGSCGVVPAVLYLLQENNDFSEKKILRALATAGLIGNIVKENASISGAEVGCQGEIGTACAMASAATVQLFGGTSRQIEYAAEIGMEHHLGLTCDPVAGLVQIPCIERNVFAAARALDANLYAIMSDGKHKVGFDKVVQTMKQTGLDILSKYRETSEGGLAKFSGM